MELCLISCNIRFDNPADGPNAWIHRKDFLSETLIQYAPSIIATQEGRNNQLHEFESLLKSFDLVEQHRSWITERMYPSIFTKNDSFDYISSGDIWLSETPDVAGSLSFGSTFPRLMTWAKLQLKTTNSTFLIINTHLDHMKTGTRMAQMKVLTENINSLWDKESFLIVMGDFNDSPESDVRTLLSQKFTHLQDAWKIFNKTEETSHHSFKGEMQNGSRIDWILVDERLNVVECFMDKSVKNNIYPSDHYPIVCKITL